MPKPPPNLPDFSTGEAHLLSKEDAAYVVRKRAYTVLVWTDFGWASVRKYEIIEMMLALSPSQKVSVRKVPKFAVYRFWIAE